MSKTATTSDQAFSPLAPIKGLMAASIKHWEQWSHWQLASSQAYCDIGFEQLRKMAAITNMEQAQAVAWNNIEPVSAINKQLLSDWQSWVKLHNQYKNDVSAAFSTSSPANNKTANKKQLMKPIAPCAATKPSA
jgi:phasin family protein